MLNFECAIFDLDGVIVSTDEYHYEAWKYIADKEDIIFNRAINNQLRGVSRKESMDIILRNAKRVYSQAEKDSLMYEKNERYVTLLEQLSQENVMPGTHKLLRELKENNIKLAIGSSSKNAKLILEKLNLMEFFDVIVDGTMIKHSKPAPEVFLLCKSLLGQNNNTVIVFEDAEAGIIAAKKAQCIGIAIGENYLNIQGDFGYRSLDEIDLTELNEKLESILSEVVNEY